MGALTACYNVSAARLSRKYNQGSFEEDSLAETHECSVSQKQQKSTWAKAYEEGLWSRSSGLSQMGFSHENNRHYHGSRRNKEDTEIPGKDRTSAS